MVRCGPPTYKEITGPVTTDRVEVWTYNCGINDYIYALYFEKGLLVRIESQGRGSGESDCKGAAGRK